jgi:hypothetical protein
LILLLKSTPPIAARSLYLVIPGCAGLRNKNVDLFASDTDRSAYH